MSDHSLLKYGHIGTMPEHKLLRIVKAITGSWVAAGLDWGLVVVRYRSAVNPSNAVIGIYSTLVCLKEPLHPKDKHAVLISIFGECPDFQAWMDAVGRCYRIVAEY